MRNPSIAPVTRAAPVPGARAMERANRLTPAARRPPADAGAWLASISPRCALLALLALLTVPAAGGSARAQEPGARMARAVSPPASPAPAALADEPATVWLPTTDRALKLLFSLSRDEEGCVTGCERYKLWLRYTEPAAGPTPSAQWLDASHTSCLDYWVDGKPDVACASFGQMAGRDRHGRDWVLLQLYSSRAQLDRMRRSRALIFQFGDHSFHLTGAGRAALERFLAESGGR